MGSVAHEIIWIHIIEIFYEFLLYIIYYVYIISLWNLKYVRNILLIPYTFTDSFYISSI